MGSKSSKSSRASPPSPRGALSPAPPDTKVLRSPLPRGAAHGPDQPPSSAAAATRVLFKAADERPHRPREPPASAAGVSLADVCTASSTRRAEQLKQQEAADVAAADGDGLSRFAKYRNFFKNHDTELARAITRLVTRANKRELRAWVAENVGALERLDTYGKLELVELAMVSAAIARHGEKALAAMDARGELAALPNTALHTHDLRMASKQQACRAQSKAADKRGKQAAHYVGLEVMMTLNARLPVGDRVGDELREILNHPSNLRLVSAAANQSLHKKADSLLLVDYAALAERAAGEGSPEEPAKKPTKAPRNKPTPQEYARLAQVAKHAQSDGFQEAMRAAKGQELYRSLRDQFLRLDVGARRALWDVSKDTIVSSKGAATKVEMDTSSSGGGGGKRRKTPSRSPSPAVGKAAQQSPAKPARGSKSAAAAAKPSSNPRRSKAAEQSAASTETHNPIVRLVSKLKGSKKAAKDVEKHARPARAPKATKQSKENRPEPNNAAKKAAAKPSTRRVTRSRGGAELVALPDSFSDSSEYEDDSDE